MTPYALYIVLGSYALFCLFVISLACLAWRGFEEDEEELDDVEIIEDDEQEEDRGIPGSTQHLCGSTNTHFEDYSLADSLEVGQVYHKVLSQKRPSCLLEGDTYYLVWLVWYSNNQDRCGYDELVAFPENPPECFVFAKNGDIVEVKNGTREQATGGN